MTEPKVVGLYARVSTHNGQDPEVQLRELREHCRTRELRIHREYVDRGASGSRASRPALDQLMRDAARHRFDTVLVWRLDRFGRSVQDLHNLVGTLQDQGVAFISLRDNFDLTTKTGELLFGVLAVVAQFEGAIIRERVRSGVALARSRGKRLGRPTRKPRPKFNPTTGEIFAQVKQLRARKVSFRKIGKQLNISPQTAFNLSKRRSL